MSGIKIKSTAIYLPSIHGPGTMYKADDGSLEEKVLEELGPIRKGFAQVGRLSPFFNVRDLKPGEEKQLTKYQIRQRALATKLQFETLEPVRKVLERAEFLREFIKKLPYYIQISGIKEKYTLDNSSKQDPLLDMGVYLVKKLMADNGLNADQIDALYVSTTTSRANDTEIATRLQEKLWLMDNKSFPRTVIEKWKTKVIPEGCVGSINMMEEIENATSTGEIKTVIALSLANNSIHMKGNNPHEIITYADGGGGMLIISTNNAPGTISVSPLKKNLRHATAVTHNMKEAKGKGLRERIESYFTSNILDSKKIALDISNRVPSYTLELMNSNQTKVNDFNHIFFSQTSANVIKRIEITIAEDYGKSIGVQNPQKGSEGIYDYFYKLVDSGKPIDTAIYQALPDNERNLLEFMILLHDTVVRVYQIHGYTGVASIPMALAHYVEEGLFDLEKDNALFVASGMGGKIQGAAMLNSKPVIPTSTELKTENVIEENGNGNGNGHVHPRSVTNRFKQWLLKIPVKVGFKNSK